MPAAVAAPNRVFGKRAVNFSRHTPWICSAKKYGRASRAVQEEIGRMAGPACPRRRRDPFALDVRGKLHYQYRESCLTTLEAYPIAARSFL